MEEREVQMDLSAIMKPPALGFGFGNSVPHPRILPES
jgi:hypothetical protein